MFKFLFFVVHVILFLIAATEIIRSDRETLKKMLWLLFILFFPVFGLIIYYLFGRRPRARLEAAPARRIRDRGWVRTP